MFNKILSRPKIQGLLWEKAGEIIKRANSEDVRKKELVKLLLEMLIAERFTNYVILALLIASVVINILEFII